MRNAVLNRTLQRSRNYYDIPTENTVVILTADLFRKIKTLPIALAKITLDTIHSSYPNLMMTDVILYEATGNVFHPFDRLVCAWAERCNVSIMTTSVGKSLKDGELPIEAASDLSVEEAALLCPPGTRTYRIDSDGSAWFRFRPMEVADLNLPVSRGDAYLPHIQPSISSRDIDLPRSQLTSSYRDSSYRERDTYRLPVSRPMSPSPRNIYSNDTYSPPVANMRPAANYFTREVSGLSGYIKPTRTRPTYRSLSSLLAA